MDSKILVPTLLALLALSGCDQNVAPPGAARRAEPATRVGNEPQSRPPADEAAATKTTGDSAAGLGWTPPANWISEPPRTMRAATYGVPPVTGQGEAGECAVFYFGAGQGGDVAANLQRWISQFQQPGGKSSEEAAKTAKQKINGLNVTTIDLSGTYLASAGPMAPSRESKPGYRLLGAIVEAPQGNVFFKFTGPAQTVADNAGAFQAMLNSLHKD